MKKFFSFLVATLVMSQAFSQVKISDLPAASGTCVGCLVPVVQSGVTKKLSVASKAYVDSGFSTKQGSLVSGTNIKTINGTSVLGGGNMTIGALPLQIINNNSPYLLNAAGVPQLYSDGDNGLLANDKDGISSLNANDRTLINSSSRVVLSWGDQLLKFGDVNTEIDGNVIAVNLNNGTAYYDVDGHIGKFGINTNAPTAALEVNGDIKAGSGTGKLQGVGGVISIGDVDDLNSGSKFIFDADNSLLNIQTGELLLDGNLHLSGGYTILASQITSENDINCAGLLTNTLKTDKPIGGTSSAGGVVRIGKALTGSDGDAKYLEVEVDGVKYYAPLFTALP